MATVLELKQAGYSDEDISLWVEDKKKKFNSAGYTQLEQSEHLGIPFKTTNSLINNQMIGPSDPQNYDFKNLDNNLTEQQKIELEINTNTETDNLTEELEKQEADAFNNYVKQQMELADIDPNYVPYKFRNSLEEQAFANKNKLNLDINKKIYDDRGLPLDEKYHSNFTTEEDYITPHGGTSGNTINIIDGAIYKGLGLKDEEKRAGAFLLNETLKQYSKLLTGNESWGSRSYSWGDGTFGSFRMNAEQVQTGINKLIDVYTNANQPLPYWLEDLTTDKDISGLTKDGETALFLSYMSTQPNFQRDFLELIRGKNQKTAVRDLLFNNFLIPRKIKPKEFEVLSNRLTDNLNKHWLQKEFKSTTRQIPAFGKWMPDIISMSGDNLFGEGRRNTFVRGWDQSVTSMAYRLYNDLKELNATGENPMDYQKLIDSFMTNGQRWDKRAMAGITSVLSDLGVFGLGSASATVATLGTTGPFAAMGGAFGLHEALRWSLMEAYRQNELGTFEDFWSIVLSKAAAKHYGKGFGTGLMVAAGGKYGSKIVGYSLAKTPLKNTAVGQKMINFATGTGKAGGEIAMLAQAPHIMEWIASGGKEEFKIPTKEEFLDAAVIIFGLKAGHKGWTYAKDGTVTGIKTTAQWLQNGTEKLYQIYAKTGKTPKTVLKDAEKDPSILDDLQNKDKPIPDAYVNIINVLNKRVDQLSGKNQIEQNTVPAPKFIVGNKVKTVSTGIESGEIISIGFKNGEHVYKIKKPDGELINLPESAVEKSIPKKEIIVWEDPTEFKVKQQKGEYDSKIEILERDNQLFETTTHRTSQAIFEGYKEIGTSTDGKAQTNRMMLWIKEYYPNLVKEGEKLIQKGKKLEGEIFNLTIDQMVKRILPEKLNEYPIRLLFKVDKNNNLGAERQIVVGEVDGKIFNFDLQSYMALKKLKDGSDAVVTAHLGTNQSGTARGVMIFRDSKGNTTGLLMSRASTEKITNEAIKFRNEFGTRSKSFADAQPSSVGSQRGFPKWDDLNLNPDTNVFKGLQLSDLVKIFKDLSGDSVIAKNIRSRKGFITLGLFYPRGKGEIVLNEKLFDTRIYLEDGTSRPATKAEYRKKLESVLMTMAHELGHFIDYIPDASMARGNILGRIKSLKGFMKSWTEGKEGGFPPLTALEKAAMKRTAEKRAREREKETDKELKEEGIDPKDILKIITDARAREILPPEVYEGFAKANTALKKEIIKDAMKGIVNPYIRNIVKGGEKNATNSQKAEAEKIFKEMFEKEVIKRGLAGRDQVMNELKRLTQRWKPFNDKMKNDYRDYRYSSPELFADFMMSFLLQPKQTLKAAPITTSLWLNFMHKKPEVMREYEMIQMELALPKDQKIANLIKEQVITSMENTAKMQKKANEELQSEGSYDTMRRWFDYHAFTIINYYKKVMGDNHWWSSPTSKKRFETPLKDNVEQQIERYQYTDALIEGLQNKLYKVFWKPMLDSGINRHIFATYLQNRLVMNPSGTRANVLNPKGIDRFQAEAIVRQLEQKYSGDRANGILSIRELAERFYDYRQKEIITVFEELGLDPISLEIARSNKEYVTFAVEEYARFMNDTWVKGFVQNTKFGTSKDVMNVLDATILKDWALITVLQRHQMISTSVRFLKNYKEQIEGLDRKQLQWNGRFKGLKIVKPIKERVYEEAVWDFMKKKWKPKTKNLDTSSVKAGYKLVEWMENGERKAAYIGTEIADALNGLQSSRNLVDLHRFTYGINTPYRKLFTEINPPFWGYNVFRDIFRTVQNLDGASLFDLVNGGKNSFLKKWVQSLPIAYRSIFDPKNADPIVLEMLQNREILSVWSKYRNRAEGLLEGDPNWSQTTDGAVRSFLLLSREKNWRSMSKEQIEAFFEKVKDKEITEYSLEELNFNNQLRDNIINSYEKRFMETNWLGKGKTGFLIGENSWIQPYYKLITSSEMMSRVLERTTKIAAKRDLLDRRQQGLIDWSDAQIEYAVRNWAGSPNFLRKGNGAWLYNNLFLFGNVFKEANRSTLEAKRYHTLYKIPFTDKYWAAGWYGKLFQTTIAPKIFYRAAKLGMFGSAAHMYFNLIGNDVLANYTVIPLGVINEKGEFETGMDSQDGNLKAVYLQFPLDEFQKFIGALSWHSMIETWGDVKDDNETNVFETLMKTGVGVLDENTPSLTPFLPLVSNAIKSLGLTETLPKDYYTGKDLYPEYLQKAEGMLAMKMRMKAWSKYAWNNAGGLMFYKFDTYYDPFNQKKIITEIEEKLSVPIFGKTLGRFIKVSDRGIKERVWEQISKNRVEEDTAKVIVDNAMQKIMSDDGTLNMDKLTAEEKNAMLTDTTWVNRYNKAVSKTFGNQWSRLLSGLEGKDLLEAIQEMTKIEYDFRYNFNYDENELNKKEEDDNIR
jgi:hypothetical protein